MYARRALLLGLFSVAIGIGIAALRSLVSSENGLPVSQGRIPTAPNRPEAPSEASGTTAKFASGSPLPDWGKSELARPSAPKAAAPTATYEEPTTIAELRSLRARCRNLPAYLATVDKLYDDESRDEQWSTQVETAFTRAAGAIPGVTVLKGDCRTSLCRYQIEISESAADYNFGDHVKDLVNGTQYDGDLEWLRIRGTNVFTFHFFSLRLPSPYARPLYELLHD